MAADDWLSAGATLLGGLLGGSKDATNSTTTSTNSIDPQMRGYIYGNGSTIRGVLPAATDWYQANQSGLNDQSLQGLNRQWNVASDPNTAQGYTNMQSLGSSLMGGGVAGNPFTTGKASLGGGSLGLGGQSAVGTSTPQLQFQNPATMGSSMSGSSPFTQPTNTWQPQTQQSAINSWLQQIPGGSSGIWGSGGSSGSNGASGSLFGGMNGNGMPGEGGGLTLSDALGYAQENPGTASTVAGGLFGPVGSFASRVLTGLLGYASAPDTGQINNFGNRNTMGFNSAYGTSQNQVGMGGWGGGGNSSSNNGGGDSSRGSQSDSGGRNGGDSGGF